MQESEGRIAGEFLYLYPPGIPLLVPGERISEEIVQLWLASGGTAHETVTVLKEA